MILKKLKEKMMNEKKPEWQDKKELEKLMERHEDCLLYTSPSPRDGLLSRMPSSA